jgi:inhibitor of cysteine peptidase
MKNYFNLDSWCCPGKSEQNNEQSGQKKIKETRKNTSSLSLFILLFFVINFFILGGVLLIYKMNNDQIKNPPINPSKEENVGAVQKFRDYAELKEFIEKNAIFTAYDYDSYLGGVNTFEKRMDVSMEASPNIGIESWGSAKKPVGVSMDNGIGGGSDYSSTNVQIAGVDEGDIIKTDGKYIYAVSGDEVVIIDAYPAFNAKEISRIKLDSSPDGIYINGDRLAVYGQNYNIYNAKEYESILPRRSSNYSFLKIFDISDRSNLKQTRSFDFEGQLVNSRMIGDYVYVVTSNYNYYAYDDKFPVPMMLENGNVITIDPNISVDKKCAKCISPNVYYFDIPYRSYNFTTISSLNIKNDSEKVNSEVYLLDGQQNSMFVSQNNIYITFNKQVSVEELTMDITMDMLKEYIYPKMSESDKEIIAKIEKTDNDVLAPKEKYQKIIMLMMKYENMFEDREDEFEKEMEKRVKQKYEDISKELEKTVIHKIEIKNGSLEYKTFGEVTGRVLNQFSMDESGGYFRIATTRSRDWSRFNNDNSQSYSNIYVLDTDMKIVGKVEELAKGEQIYSVRFMQNRAYMVTFKQTDPLFVIDLSNPTKPQVLGELKVPGFSSYLHPYDETTLIGLGKESDDSGRIIGGIKLSLFDVSNVSNPTEIDKYVLGDRNSDSIAINEHKAFLFSKDKNLLAIPASMQEGIIEIQEGISFEENIKIMPPIRKYFNGVAVFNISKKGFELKGKIDHSDENSAYSWNNVSRSLYIDDVLYSLSNKYLKVNLLNTLEEVKSLEISSLDYKNPTPTPMPIMPMTNTWE